MASPPAFADTSNATANAATVLLAGNTLLTTGTCTAASPGGTSGPCGAVTPPTTPVLSVSALAQVALASGGLSGACAGAVGQGGTITINPSGICQFSAGNPSGGITINLGDPLTGIGLLVLKADAIVAECTASSTGAPTASVQLVNARFALLSLGVPGPFTTLTSPAAPNTPLLNLGALLNITLNDQADNPQPAGGVATSALVAHVLGIGGGTPLVTVTVGTVVCGPNAVTPPTPAFPRAGAPIALGMFLIAGYVGWRFWWVPRRRTETIDA
jgi:hypothetical protein